MKNLSSSTLSNILRLEKSGAIVLFAGDWCPDCREFMSTWERWTTGKAVPLYVIDVPRGGTEWKEWNLDEIPTVAAFSRGRELARLHGTITRDDLDDLLEKMAAKPKSVSRTRVS